MEASFGHTHASCMTKPGVRITGPLVYIKIVLKIQVHCARKHTARLGLDWSPDEMIGGRRRWQHLGLFV